MLRVQMWCNVNLDANPSNYRKSGKCNSYHNDNIPIYTNKRTNTNHFFTKVQPQSICEFHSYVKLKYYVFWNYQKLRLVLGIERNGGEQSVVLHIVSLK